MLTLISASNVDSFNKIREYRWPNVAHTKKNFEEKNQNIRGNVET
jgi:hypothetical protein